jgi:hypothetical protein
MRDSFTAWQIAFQLWKYYWRGYARHVASYFLALKLFYLVLVFYKHTIIIIIIIFNNNKKCSSSSCESEIAHRPQYPQISISLVP